MGKKQIDISLNIFTKRVKRMFRPRRVVLFGSYARGEASDYSDIDVVVVSRNFGSIPLEKRLDVLYPLTQDLYPDFHVFGLTPEEFDDLSPTSSIAEVKTQGVSLL